MRKLYPRLIPLLNKLPANGTLNYLMGYCLDRINRNLEESIGRYDMALQNGFDEFWIRYHQGFVSIDSGNFIESLRALQRATTLNPTHNDTKTMLRL